MKYLPLLLLLTGCEAQIQVEKKESPAVSTIYTTPGGFMNILSAKNINGHDYLLTGGSGGHLIHDESCVCKKSNYIR